MTNAITVYGPDDVAATYYLWSGTSSLPATGLPTAQFMWERNDQGLSGQIIFAGKLSNVGALGRFHVLLAPKTQPMNALPGQERLDAKYHVCVDSTGAEEVDTKPVPRCDRPQTVRGGPSIPATLTQAEAEPFKRLHAKIRVSPLHCGSDEIAYCEDMVRVSCGAERDAPIHYYDNASGERLGTCGFWVRDPTCMPQRWRVCAVKNRVRHIGEEPDPSR